MNQTPSLSESRPSSDRSGALGAKAISFSCVCLLEWAARKLGTTYNAINVWIFCVIWPAITIGLIIAVIVLWRKVAVLQHP